MYAAAQHSGFVEGENPAAGAAIAKTRIKRAWGQRDFIGLSLDFDIQNSHHLLPIAFPGTARARALEMNDPPGLLDAHLGDCGCPSGADEQQQEACEPKQRVGYGRTQRGNHINRPDGVKSPADRPEELASEALDFQSKARPGEQGEDNHEILSHDIGLSESADFELLQDWQFEFASYECLIKRTFIMNAFYS